MNSERRGKGKKAKRGTPGTKDKVVEIAKQSGRNSVMCM